MIKYYNWWSNPDTERWFTEFFGYMLKDFTTETSNGVLNSINLVSVFGGRSAFDVSKAISGIKIFFTGENLKRQGYDKYDNDKALSNAFDLVLGFRDKPENLRNVFRFPLWLTYIPFYKNLTLTRTHATLCHTSHERPVKGIMVASHDRTGIRKRCIDECIAKGIKVDVAGKASIASAASVAIGPLSADKIRLLKSYLVNVCPENSYDVGYTTEKVFQAIEAGCVPVYSGCKPVEERILNQSRIIYVEDMEKLTTSEIVEKSKLIPYTSKASFWIMKYYLEMWAKVWFLAHHHQNIKFVYPKTVEVHNYFIIPYRNREEHLYSWTMEVSKKYTHLKYTVILIEQDDDKPFNKGVLLNVGFWKAMELHHLHYNGVLTPRPNLIFNDVDVFCNDVSFLRPEEYVYHPYGDGHCLGCIFICSPEAYLSFNGFSNNYNGWGREDADALLRCKIQKIPVKEDKYEQRRSGLSFVEFTHQSNVTTIKENYAEYKRLEKDNLSLYNSGVCDDLIVKKMMEARVVEEKINNVLINHLFV